MFGLLCDATSRVATNSCHNSGKQTLRSFQVDATDAISHIREVLAEAKKSGSNSIQIHAFDEFLEAFGERAQATDPEVAKRRTAIEVEQIKYRASAELELFKAVIEAGQTAIKSALLINGGAAVTLLAFLGNLLTKPTSTVPTSAIVTDIGFALLIFVASVGAAGVASGIRYFAQVCFQRHESPKMETLGNFVTGMASLLVLGSFFGFFCGGYKAYEALIK